MYRVSINYTKTGSYQGGSVHSYQEHLSMFSKNKKTIDSLTTFLSKYSKKVTDKNKKTKKKKKGGGKKTFSQLQKKENKDYYACIKKCKYGTRNYVSCLKKCNSKRTRTLKKLERLFPEKWNKFTHDYMTKKKSVSKKTKGNSKQNKR